ncbi:hypothetical protein F4777DRAFT_522440 [Nemania sp. FL0916]|nr:hypothetical protein F4777DRAFT_522440 [Nemania sp. FL0916]
MSLDQLHTLPDALQQAILNGPALKAPPGIESNLDNPPNANSLGIAVTTICLFTSTVAFALAASARLWHMKKIHLEDFFALSGFALALTFWSFSYQNLNGFGFHVHLWNVRVRDLAHFFYVIHIGSIIYAVSIMLFKIAILLQWTRLFIPRGTKGVFYWTCRTMIIISVLWYSITVILICISCRPYNRIWDRTVPGTCPLNREALDVTTASFNLLSDLIILILPQGVIWKLHIETRKKIGVALIFLVGLFAVVAAASRLHASVKFLWSVDRTYDITPVSYWAFGELTCAALIYCVPSIPGLFKNMSRARCTLPALFSSPIRCFRPVNKGSRLPSLSNKHGSRAERPSSLDSLCDLDGGYRASRLRSSPENSLFSNFEQHDDHTFRSFERLETGLMHPAKAYSTDKKKHTTSEISVPAVRGLAQGVGVAI